MFRINLLPEAERRVAPSLLHALPRTPLAWIVFTVMVAIPLLLWVPLQMARQQLNRVEVALQPLRPQKEEADRLQQLIRELQAQQGLLHQGTGNSQATWWQRLNALSDLLPDGVWLTEIAFDQAKGLVIEGMAIGQGDPELVGVARLVQGVKADARFASLVTDVEIDSVKRMQDGAIEVAQFHVTCALRGEGRP